MSQAIESTDTRAEQGSARPREFSYRPICPSAVISMVLAVLGLVAFLTILGLVLPFLGLILGVVALLQVRGAKGEMGGRFLATSGLVLSCLVLTGGTAYHSYVFATEVPEGYERKSFNRDISKKGFVQRNGVTEISPAVKQLDGQKIFVKGYMYPLAQTEGLPAFILVKDSEKCCFGGNPDQTDMIVIYMQEGLVVDYVPGLVAVAGVFKSGAPQVLGELQPVYEMKCKHFDRAKTSY